MYCFLTFDKNCGYLLLIPFISFGLFFAIYSSAIWPAVPMVVEKKMIGMAYGLINAANNIGLAFYPFVFGYINVGGKSEDYNNSIWVLIGLCIIGLISSIIIQLVSCKNGNILDNPERVRKTESI